MPTTRLEEWRYTDLRKLLDLSAAPPLRMPSGLPATIRRRGLSRPPRDDGSRTAKRPDTSCSSTATWFTPISIGALAEQGVDPRLAPRSRSRRTRELVQEHLYASVRGRHRTAKFEALNVGTAGPDGIFVLHVPEGPCVSRRPDPGHASGISESGAASSFSRVAHRRGSRTARCPTSTRSSPTTSRTRPSSPPRRDRRATTARFGAVREAPARRARHLRAALEPSDARRATRASIRSTSGSRRPRPSRADLNARSSWVRARIRRCWRLYFGDGDQHFDFNTARITTEPNTRERPALQGCARR